MRQDLVTIEQPATRWEDALPSGNGHLGAMVYGAIHDERILLNHEALWLPLFERPTLPNLAQDLPHYRRLLESLQFQEADLFWSRQLKEKGWPEVIYTNPYMPACDLQLRQETDAAFSGYRRQLEMSTGEVNTRWTAQGVVYDRRLFVSRADQVIVMHVSASQPRSIHLTASLRPHSMVQENRKTWHYPRRYTPEELPVRYSFGAEFDRLWLDCSFTSPGGGGHGGLAKVVAKGGTVNASDSCVDVRDADSVLIFIKLEPRRLSDAAREKVWKEFEGLSTDYPALLSRHAALHRELFNRVRFELDTQGVASDATNEALVADAYRSEVSNALSERLYHFGRYLFISSTATGGWPPNLQGVWNGDYIPAWSCDYTIDENVQMNHWQALSGDLPELLEPYFRYFEGTLPDWRENAQRFYGCRGVMAPLRQSDNGLMSENMPYLIWTAGAGWIAQLFYDFALFTGDQHFLAERAVPFLKEVALFYEDFLYPGPNGEMIVCPSMSPENIPDLPGATRPSLNPTMDIAVCREVLTNLIDACDTLGTDAESVARWRALLEALPAYQINEDGALKEWLYPGLKDNYHHRHLSHLYGVFPGREITPSSSPELFAACKTAVEMRKVIGLKSQTSWSLAHMANLYARLHRGEQAMECIDLIARSCLGTNLFTYHNDWRGQGITINDGMYPPFQIDANLGLTAAVQEMLAFSTPGRIDVLPALPKRWSSGRIVGLKAHGDITLSIAWTPSQVTITLLSKSQQVVVVSLPPDFSVKAESAADHRSHRSHHEVEILLEPSEKHVLSAVRR